MVLTEHSPQKWNFCTTLYLTGRIHAAHLKDTCPTLSVLCSRFLHQLEYGHGAHGNSNILLQLIRSLFTRTSVLSLSLALSVLSLTHSRDSKEFFQLKNVTINFVVVVGLGLEVVARLERDLRDEVPEVERGRPRLVVFPVAVARGRGEGRRGRGRQGVVRRRRPLEQPAAIVHGNDGKLAHSAHYRLQPGYKVQGCTVNPLVRLSGHLLILVLVCNCNCNWPNHGADSSAPLYYSDKTNETE